MRFFLYCKTSVNGPFDEVMVTGAFVVLMLASAMFDLVHIAQR